MTILRRPWDLSGEAVSHLGPSDCFLSEEVANHASETARAAHEPLLSYPGRELRLFPYPKTGAAPGPPAVAGLPARPRTGQEPVTEAEQFAANSRDRMHAVIGRIGELEAALDDPERLWERLAEAWRRAEDEAIPHMAEIVRQARTMPAHLFALENRIRRVLRRTRERLPLDRVQEMDRSSMIWLARQPGSTTVERAGPAQRVLAIARHENFNTLENRVLRAYLHLARLVARQWLREHERARATPRYKSVLTYSRKCRRIERELETAGVGLVTPGMTANYVLMEDRDYRAVHEAWVKLLRQERPEDEFWAWQAQNWTDFCTLALTLSLHQIEDSELVVQSPLVWLDDARAGRRFLHDRPLAVFWLRREGLVVEVQARPAQVSQMQFACRAWVWLRISDLSTGGIPRRVPVWTPHAFERLPPRGSAAEAAALAAMVSRIGRHEVLRDGVILMPAHGDFERHEARNGRVRVASIALDASGTTLARGMAALGEFVRTCMGAP